jgi:uncharacterized protein (DUF427 family)
VISGPADVTACERAPAAGRRSLSLRGPERNHADRRVVGMFMATGHKITILSADDHVEVKVGGQTVADSDRALRLDETGMPARYYIPRDDVRADLLVPTEHRSTCPYKGEASYWSVKLGDDIYDNVVWSYESPISDAAAIKGLLCFYNERVDLTVARREGLDSQTAASR